MKKKTDPRHQKRIKVIKSLFAQAARGTKIKSKNLTVQKINSKLNKIDQIIRKHAPAWPVEQISPIDLSILQLAIWELCFFKKTPVKVAIDEAVELAKEFGSESSSSFVNGVLGSVVESQIKKGNSKS